MKEMEWEKSVVTGSNPWAQEKRLWWRNFKYQPAGKERMFSTIAFATTPGRLSNVVLLTHVLKQLLLSSNTEWMRDGNVESEFLKCTGDVVLLGIYCMPPSDKESPVPQSLLCNVQHLPLVRGRDTEADRISHLLSSLRLPILFFTLPLPFPWGPPLFSLSISLLIRKPLPPQ